MEGKKQKLGQKDGKEKVKEDGELAYFDRFEGLGGLS
jgi:hypothetical protein